MKRTVRRVTVLLILAACIGLVPVDTAARGRLVHPTRILPPDLVEVGWTQMVSQAVRFIRIPPFVHPFPIWTLFPEPGRLVRERPTRPNVFPNSDREPYRSRTR